MDAKQLVNALLEYGLDPNAPNPGSPEDPWRQGGHKPIKFRRGDFEGQRPQNGPVPIQKPDVPPKKKKFGGLGNRMDWKPPQA